MSSSNKLHVAGLVDAQAAHALLRPNATLAHAVSNSQKYGLPAIAVSPLQGQYLAIQAQLLGAKTVLEIGALGGYSTVWLASTGAHVTSIEIDPKHRAVALENTRGQGLENVEVLLGAALEVMPRLAEEGRKFDMVFVDAAWDEQREYFDCAVKLTRKGGAVYVDNVVRELFESGKLEVDDETLVTKVGRDERVQATLLQTVSSHKDNLEDRIDGFILAIVK